MGLDMYLERYPKELTVRQYRACDELFELESVRKKEPKYADITLEKWCGIPETDLPSNEEIEKCRKLYVPHPYYWDTAGMFANRSIEEHVGYWRKANQIHNWFVENVQGGEDDCGSYVVSEEQLEELKSLCEQVLEDHSLAGELLPTCSGFFFGDTEYDEWYFNDLQNTLKIINEVLYSTDFTNQQIVYSASW